MGSSAWMRPIIWMVWHDGAIVRSLWLVNLTVQDWMTYHCGYNIILGWLHSHSTVLRVVFLCVFQSGAWSHSSLVDTVQVNTRTDSAILFNHSRFTNGIHQVIASRLALCHIWLVLPNRCVSQTDRQDSQDESLSERPAELVGDGVRHRDGKHGAEFQRSQLPVREALHRHARVWWAKLNGQHWASCHHISSLRKRKHVKSATF